MAIWLIEQLDLDPLENVRWSAIGYRIVGFVRTEAEAQRLVESSHRITGDGWPLERGETLRSIRATRVEEYSQ